MVVKDHYPVQFINSPVKLNDFGWTIARTGQMSAKSH